MINGGVCAGFAPGERFLRLIKSFRVSAQVSISRHFRLSLAP